MVQTISANSALWLKYGVPAFLYCVYNNLVYINLSTFDPGTYNVLMQLKIVPTGVTYQIIFARKLNRNQWLAIVLIAVGCMSKEAGKLNQGMDIALKTNAWGWLLLLVQLMCSCFAGVYNEALLKGDTGSEVTTNLQNAFMASQSILANTGVLLVQGRLGEALSLDNASAIFTPSVLSIVLIMASVGLVTGFFLKHLDSILKAIASALEVVFTMIFGFLVFGVPLSALGVLSAVIVGAGVALYSRPVDAVKASKPQSIESSEMKIGASDRCKVEFEYEEEV